MELTNAVIELLGQHTSLVVPNFGTLKTIDTPSRTDESGNFYQRERRLKSFDDTHSQNDGVLTDYMTKKYHISNQIATKKIQGSVSYWKSQLKKGPLNINGIGIFEYDKDGQVQFRPAQTLIPLPQFFGFPQKIENPLSKPHPSKEHQSSSPKITSTKSKVTDCPPKSTTIPPKPNIKKSVSDATKKESAKTKATSIKTQERKQPSKSQKISPQEKISDQTKSNKISKTKRLKINQSHLPPKKAQSDTKQGQKKSSRLKTPPFVNKTSSDTHEKKKKIKPGDSYYHRRKNRRPTIPYLLVGIFIGLVLGAGGTYFFISYLIPPSQPIVETVIVQSEAPPEVASTEEKSDSIDKEKETIKDVNPTTIAEGDLYAIVIGSFDSETKANQYIDVLKSQNLDARISNKADQSRVRVIIGFYRSLPEAITALNDARAKIKADAWILKEN